VERIARGAAWDVTVAGRTHDVAVDAVVNAASSAREAIAARRRLSRRSACRPSAREGQLLRLAWAEPPSARLIYPAPVDGGLGTHVTLDLAGRMRFGPDVEWIEAEDYEVNPRRAESFYASIRRYWPGLPDGALVPDYAGIRPKLTGPGEKAADFMIDGPQEHGLPGLVHLFGIESPGLTSALSIAEDVAERLAP
jgi:L-2-hydroxyglutarate oxidase LhgO